MSMRRSALYTALFLVCLVLLVIKPPPAWAVEMNAVPQLPDIPESLACEDKPERRSLPLAFELKLRGYNKTLDTTSLSDRVSGGEFSGRLYGSMSLDDANTLLVNLRASMWVEEYTTYTAQEHTHFATQELALRHAFTPAFFVIAGRSNIRGGVASGFNPTDWFKNDSLARTDSLDVLDRREDRLGVLSLQGIYLAEGGLVQIGWRPQISTSQGSFFSHGDVVGLGLDRTNSADSLIIRVTPAWWDNLSLTPSLYYEEKRYGAGFEASIMATEHLVLYGEWAVRKRKSLLAEAAEKEDNCFLASGTSLYNQLVIGGTWSLPEYLTANQEVALSVEYHYNEAGLDTRELQQWKFTHRYPAFHLPPRLAGMHQEPSGRHQLFTRVTWNDIIKTSDLSLISTVSLQDGSGFSQATWKIPVDEYIRLEAQGYIFWGGDISLYGSVPSTQGVGMSIIYSF